MVIDVDEEFSGAVVEKLSKRKGELTELRRTHRRALLTPRRQWRAKYPPAGTLFYGDDRKIKELLLNLLSNAIKFTPERGTILFNSSTTDNELRISVIDSGIGIAPQYQERIFDTFDQGDPEVAKTHGGSGLGLALVKQMVELHHGKVWLESAVGQGSTFSVSLPLVPNKRPAAAANGHQKVAKEKTR